MTRSRIVVALFAAAAMVAACTEEPLTPVVDSSGGAVEALAHSHLGTGVDRWFDLDLEINGSLEVGSTVTIIAHGRSTGPARTAEVRIFTPELTLIAAGAPVDRFSFRTGTTIPAAAERTSDLTSAPTTAVARLPIPAFGVYKISASVRPETEVEVDPWTVQPASRVDRWLWVTEDGSFLTDDFDVERFPDGVQHQPGPFRVEPERRTTLPMAASSRFQPASYLGPDVPVDVNYVRDTDGVTVPITGARVYIYYEYFSNTTFQLVNETQVVYTDASGQFRLDCDVLDKVFGTYALWDADVRLENSMVRLREATGDDGRTTNALYGSTAAGDLFGACEGWEPPREITTHDEAGHVYTNFNTDIPLSRTSFGHSRPRLNVDLWQDAPTDSSSFYEQQTDRIVIVASPYESHVWGPENRWTQSHEYGHALHEKRLGKIPSVSTTADRRNEPSDMPFAYKEGFADFHGTVVTGYLSTTLENNGYYPGVDDDGNLDGDGGIIEGAVAAFLYDLWDPPNEAHDDISLSASYIADVMSSCEYSRDGNEWHHPNGIDIIVWCLEGAVDTALINTGLYFYDRQAQPKYQRSNVVPVGSSGVREAWVHDLYLYGPDGGEPPGEDCDPVDPRSPDTCP